MAVQMIYLYQKQGKIGKRTKKKLKKKIKKALDKVQRT